LRQIDIGSKPVCHVAGYVITRWKIAGAFALGTSLIAGLGWIVSLFAGKIVAWILSLMTFSK
jgi:hypothetical protein